MEAIPNAPSDLMAVMNGSGSSKKSIAVEAQDRFMTLLVTQMKNQDPLNPLDNAQVTSQLAQLSAVSGIDKLNTALAALISSVQTGQALQASSMIGRDVLVPGSELKLAGGKAVLGIELDEPADHVSVTVRDASGNPLRKIELGPRDAGIAALTWDGRTTAGTAVSDGGYAFDVSATRGGHKVATGTLVAGRVESVSNSAGGVKVNIPGGEEVPLTEVRRIL